MIIFLFIIVVLFSLIHGYVAHKFIPRLSVSSFTQVILWAILFFMAMAPLIPPVLRSWNVENSAIDSLALFGYTSLGFFTLAFSFLIVFDLVVFSAAMIKKLGRFFKSKPETDTPDGIDPARREFMFRAVQSSIIIMSAGLTGYGFFKARKGPDIIRVDIPLENCPSELDGMRIVQLSDLHVGPTIKKDYVRKIVESAGSLDPDLLVVTGDLVDGSVDYLSSDVLPLSELTAPLGKFFCTGNHEYYAGVYHWLNKIEELGFKNLLNEHVILEFNGGHFCLAGVNDITAHYRNPEQISDPFRAFSGVPSDLFKILLAHQPGSIYDAQQLGVDLQLSGHTHGGQFFPFNLAVGLAHPFTAGLHDYRGTRIYVNRGTGYWGPPLRIGIPSEISVLTLRRADNRS